MASGGNNIELDAVMARHAELAGGIADVAERARAGILDGRFDHVRKVIAEHGAHSPQAQEYVQEILDFMRAGAPADAELAPMDAGASADSEAPAEAPAEPMDAGASAGDEVYVPPNVDSAIHSVHADIFPEGYRLVHAMRLDDRARLLKLFDAADARARSYRGAWKHVIREFSTELYNAVGADSTMVAKKRVRGELETQEYVQEIDAGASAVEPVTVDSESTKKRCH